MGMYIQPKLLCLSILRFTLFKIITIVIAEYILCFKVFRIFYIFYMNRISITININYFQSLGFFAAHLGVRKEIKGDFCYHIEEMKKQRT